LVVVGGFLLGSFLDPDNGDVISPRNIVCIRASTLRYMPEDNLTFVFRNRHEISLFGVHTGSGDHPASQAMGTGFCSGLKRQGREANHSLPTGVEVKKTWIYTFTPPHA
jgi:hypothetical protein